MKKLLILSLALVLFLSGLFAQESPAPPSAPAPAPERERPSPSVDRDRPRPIKDVLPDAKKIEGLFTFYQKKDKLYAEIKGGNLNTDYLIAIAVAQGSGTNPIGGYTYQSGGSDWLWQFRKVNDTIQVVRKNIRFKADSGTPEAKAVEVGFSDSILYSLPILAAGDGGGDVIDLASIFMADLPKLGIGSFDRSRSNWGDVKGFPNNMEFRVAATYSGRSSSAPEPGSVGVTLHYSISRLPSSGYSPRLADQRVGYFTVTHKNFSRAAEDSHVIRYINRWNIQKADSSAALSPPRKPIVFWIEKTVPFKYRHAVREGILEWNKAFEKAGFKNAIEVKFQPADADWDTLDAHHASIRWLIGTDVSFAIGPSTVDPRTGEILDADIGVGEFWVRNYPYNFREDLPQKSGASHMLTGKAGMVTASELTEMPFAMDLLEARGELDPLSPEGEEFVKESLRQLITHEVGHTLGLRHNFKASTAYTEAQLQDPAFTRKNGLANSVMDYVPVNLPLEGQKRGQLMSGALGPWDYWVIEYGYSQFDSAKESDELMKIAGRSADPLLVFATDEDNSFGIDPYVNTYDLGSDNLAYAAKRIQLSAELIKRLQNRTFKPGEPYHILRRRTMNALSQVGRSVTFVSKHIGGVSYNRDHAGTGRTNMNPISADRQREALRLLEKQIFSMDSFQFTPEFLSRLTSNRVSYSDISRPTYSPTQTMLGIQKTALSNMMSTSVAQNILEAAEKQPNAKQVFKLSELYDTLQSAIWAELKGTKEPSTIRRSLQREHLRGMLSILLKATPNMPDDARSLIRENLRQLQSQLRNAVATRSLSRETKAHFNECIALLDDSFKASLERTTF